jgi:hypothetical protein
VSEVLNKRVLQILLDLVMDRELSVWCLLGFPPDASCALSTKEVSDQHAVLPEDERVYRQRILLLVLEAADFISASGAPVTVVKPAAFDGGTELRLSLSEELIKEILDFIIFHMHAPLWRLIATG